MKQVRKLLQETKGFFQVPIKKKLCFNAPVLDNSFTLQLEKPNEKDVQVCVNTTLKFKNGYILATAHSDNPCSILFKAHDLYPKLNFSTIISSNEKNTIITNASYQASIGKVSVIPKIKLFSSYDFNCKTILKYEHMALTALYRNSERSLTLMPCYNKYGWHALSFKIINFKLIPEMYSIIPFNNFRFAISTYYPTRTISFCTIYNYKDQHKIGGNFEIQHMGHGVEPLLMLSCIHKIGSDSQIKYVLRTDQKASFELKIPYENFMKMTFTGSFEYSRTNKLQSNFGAVIVFDKK